MSELKDYYPEHEIRSLTYISIDYLLNMNKSDTIINANKIIDVADLPKFISTISDLKKYKPIQYIFSETVFYNSKFFCSNKTLIPRCETEELVDWIINENKYTVKKYLDICTGSGCIIISLCKNLKGTFNGVDISLDVLSIAQKNNYRNKTNVIFNTIDILDNDARSLLSKLNNKYDVIVSNPPYVLNSEKKQMNKNVLQWEPHLALFVDDDEPFIFYKTIANTAKKILNYDGTLYFEINERFGNEIILLLEKEGYVNIELKKDINDKDRMIKATWK